jgi:hypothetical protein
MAGVAKPRDEARPSKTVEELDRLMRLYEKCEPLEESPLPRKMDIYEGEEDLKVVIHYARKGKRNEK